MTLRTLAHRFALFALALTLGCGGTGTTPPGNDGGANLCSDEGVFLAIYGKARQSITTGSAATLKVVLTKRGENHIAGEYVTGKPVNFILGATAPGDFELLNDSATSDDSGIASAQVKAGQTAAEGIQVTASTGSCNQTFTVDVTKPARRLRFMPPNQPTRDAFTGTRVSLTAQATSDNGTALPNETVSFSLTAGKTADMGLRTLDDATTGASSLEVTTGTDGRALLRLDTGSTATTVTVRADMTGTAGDAIDIRVQLKTGGGACDNNLDCMVGQVCDTSVDPHVCTDVQSGACSGPADCTPPATCLNNICVLPDQNGTPCVCKPSSNTCEGCTAPQVCIAGYCTSPPGACTTNADCPIGWECRNGTCQPDYPCEDGCPDGWVCQAGQCQPPAPSECPIPNRPTDRLEATWAFESVLHLDEAVNPIFGGFLEVASVLQTIIGGTFGISGIPSWVTDIIQDFIQDLVSEYVPPWGLQLIQALADLHDILNEMKVWSTVQMTSWSPDLYSAAEKWDLVGFKFRGQDIQAAPEDIPEIGEINIDPYTAREVCGVYYADTHKVDNAVGGLVKWAVEVALTAITCAGGGPCYTTIEEALEDTIDCDAIGQGINDLLQSIVDSAPDVSGAVTSACEGLRTQLINKLNQVLEDIVVQLSLLKMRGEGLITGATNAPTNIGASPPPGPNGHWYGTLAGGSFNGEFKATRQ
jgi:hypothetical protein